MEDSPIDFNYIEKNPLTIGEVIGVYGLYYPISYWYVYGFMEDSITLICLDENIELPLFNPTILQIELGSFQYFNVPKEQYNPITIPANYIYNYYQFRLPILRPKYGDIVILQNQFYNYVPFFILNYDIVGGIHLALDINYDNSVIESRNINLIIPFCKYSIVSTKELRRDIMVQSRKMIKSLENKNYEPIHILDEMITFNIIMNYLFEKTYEDKTIEYEDNNKSTDDLINFESLDDEKTPLDLICDYETLETQDSESEVGYLNDMDLINYPIYDMWNTRTILDSDYIQKLHDDTLDLVNFVSKSENTGYDNTSNCNTSYENTSIGNSSFEYPIYTYDDLIQYDFSISLESCWENNEKSYKIESDLFIEDVENSGIEELKIESPYEPKHILKIEVDYCFKEEKEFGESSYESRKIEESLSSVDEQSDSSEDDESVELEESQSREDVKSIVIEESPSIMEELINSEEQELDIPNRDEFDDMDIQKNGCSLM